MRSSGMSRGLDRDKNFKRLCAPYFTSLAGITSAKSIHLGLNERSSATAPKLEPIEGRKREHKTQLDAPVLLKNSSHKWSHFEP